MPFGYAWPKKLKKLQAASNKPQAGLTGPEG